MIAIGTQTTAYQIQAFVRVLKPMPLEPRLLLNAWKQNVLDPGIIRRDLERLLEIGGRLRVVALLLVHDAEPGVRLGMSPRRLAGRGSVLRKKIDRPLDVG